MTFPKTPRDVKVELFISGAWFNITGDVMVRDSISITRGRSDESGTAAPSTVSLTLNNRAGKYSPRNPLGAFYGKIGRNTPIRVSVNGGVRFIGEVSSWPGRWDISANDAYVPIDASGILRRIGQGKQALPGSLKSYLLSTDPVTYWPLDDSSGSAVGVAAKGSFTGSWFRSLNGKAVVAFGEGFLAPHLERVLRINDTIPPSGTDEMRGYCWGSDASPSSLAMDFVYKVDTEVISGDLALLFAFLNTDNTINGTNCDWILEWRNDGANDDIDLSMAVRDVTEMNDAFFSLGNSSQLAAVTDNELHHVRLLLTQVGADIDFTVYVDGVSRISGTHLSRTLRASNYVSVSYDRLNNTDDALLAVGHVAVWENGAEPPVAEVVETMRGRLGETAGRRFERLCGEAGIPFTSTGNLDETVPMGLQYEDTLDAQLSECEQTDRGIIYEPRSTFGLAYRTRASLYNLTSAVTLDFTSLELASPFEPTEDDQTVHNDVTAQRREGGSFQATKETGPLSVQDPPNGVGRYKGDISVNPETDGMLAGLAQWLLNLGTVDEARYPRISVDLAQPAVAINPTLSAALLALDVGSYMTVADASRLFIYDDVPLLVLGYAETINMFEHTIVFNCVPYSPYQVAVYGSGVGSGPDRYDTAGSTLNSAATSTATSLSVASAGTLWTTTAGEFPFDCFVGGERVRVTNITGASSPQTFTVVRSRNGVAKAQPAGATVRLWRTPRYAL